MPLSRTIPILVSCAAGAALVVTGLVSRASALPADPCAAHANTQRATIAAIRAASLTIDQCAYHAYWEPETCAAVRRDYRRLVEKFTNPKRLCVKDTNGAWAVEFESRAFEKGDDFGVGWSLVRLQNDGGRVVAEADADRPGLPDSGSLADTVGRAYFAHWVVSMPRVATFQWSRGDATDVVSLVERASVDSFEDEEANERQWPAVLVTGRAWRLGSSGIAKFADFDDDTITDVKRVPGGWGLVSRGGFLEVREPENGPNGRYPLLGPEMLFVRRGDQVAVDLSKTGMSVVRESCRRLDAGCGLSHPAAEAFAAAICKTIFRGVGTFRRPSCSSPVADKPLVTRALRRLRALGVPVAGMGE